MILGAGRIGGLLVLGVLVLSQALTERQKQSLLDVYQSFLAQNQHAQNQQTANATGAWA